MKIFQTPKIHWVLLWAIFPIQSQLDPLLVAQVEKHIAKRTLAGRYMEQKCLKSDPALLPEWESFPVELCAYSLTDDDGTVKRALVAMLNPSPHQLARWLISACLRVHGTFQMKDADFLMNQIVNASGAQFPIAGIVLEDMSGSGRYARYVFRNGVTVKVNFAENGSTVPPNLFDIQDSFDTTKITGVKKYARIQSTSPTEYQKYGSDPRKSQILKDGITPTKVWLDVVRDSYQKAWGQDSFELLEVKALSDDDKGWFPR